MCADPTAALHQAQEHAEFQADLEMWKARAVRLERERDRYSEDAHRAWQDNDRLRKELQQAEKAIMGKITLAAPDERDRAKVLMEKIEQSVSWRGEKREHDSGEVVRRTEHLANIVKQAKTARTALAKVEGELKEILTEGEVDILHYARQALSQIVGAAGLAKEQGQRLAKQRKAHEEACAKAAKDAITKVFAGALINTEGRVLIAGWCKRDYGAFREIEDGSAFARTRIERWPKPHEVHQDILGSRLDEAVKEAMDKLEYAVVGELKVPTDAEAVAQSKLAEFKTARSQLFEKYGALVQKVQVELVARRLEQAK